MSRVRQCLDFQRRHSSSISFLIGGKVLTITVLILNLILVVLLLDLVNVVTRPDHLFEQQRGRGIESYRLQYPCVHRILSIGQRVQLQTGDTSSIFDLT